MRLIVIGILLFLNACYTYVPTRGGLPPRQAVVRTYLSEPTSFTIGQISIHGVSEVEGEVVEWRDDFLVVSASWLWSAAGQEFGGGAETLFIPRNRVAAVEQKRLSRLRTVGMVGAGAALATLLKIAMPSGSAKGGVPGGGGNPK